MINLKNCMIVIKDEIKTNQVEYYSWNKETNKHDITFTNGKMFSYLPGNVVVMRDPKVLKPENFIIWTTAGQELFDIEWIYDKKGELKKENFDASDSYVACLGYLNHKKYGDLEFNVENITSSVSTDGAESTPVKIEYDITYWGKVVHRTTYVE